MALTYLQAISIGFPTVHCSSIGDGSIYENLTWENGDPMPSKDVLDTFILNYKEPVKLSKLEFRKLFSIPERIAIDNSPNNSGLPQDVRYTMVTILNDLNSAEFIELDNPDVAFAVGFIESVGLISTGRTPQILANVKPV